MHELVFRVYADSLFVVANEENKLESIKQTYDVFVTSLEKDTAYLDFLMLPTLTTKEKFVLIDQFKFDTVFASFLKVLIENKRFDCILGIKSEFDKLYDDSKGRARGVVFTPFLLDDAEILKLSTSLSKVFNKTLLLSQKIDPSLLGGIKVEVEGKVIDASISSKLSSLALSLKES